jgi:hypothetical protein
LPGRLLVGLGGTEQSDITAQGIAPDIFERYLVGSGQNLESGWQTWNSPEGAYVNVPRWDGDHYRDNRVHYFLTHPSELVAVGGVGVVFGAGWGTQTNIKTDGGQFKNLSTAYLAHPALLP